jgi:hypothetical protein
MKMWLVKMTGEVQKLPVKRHFLAGHCPLTGRYFKPCLRIYITDPVRRNGMEGGMILMHYNYD